MSLSDELTVALENVIEEQSEELANEFRDELISRLESANQGADGLVPYVCEPERRGEGWHIEIAHPTAPLHERGGYIEPKYAQAMAMGWTRDGFYEALTDCNEFVDEKRYVRDVTLTMKRRYE